MPFWRVLADNYRAARISLLSGVLNTCNVMVTGINKLDLWTNERESMVRSDGAAVIPDHITRITECRYICRRFDERIVARKAMIGLLQENRSSMPMSTFVIV
jgi:hypothetical protein